MTQTTSERELSRRRVLGALPLAVLTGSAYSCFTRGPFPEAVDFVESEPAKLDIDIFLDTTKSMRGFVGAASASAFDTVIEDLGRLPFWFPKGTARFHRFGTKDSDGPQPFGVEMLPDLRRPSMYSGLVTRIDRVISAADPNRLVVFVTDLFQQDNDVHTVALQIRDRYIAKGLSVGVMAVRSPFQGDIFDVGIGRKAVRNWGGSRPFFVLGLGRQRDLETLFARLPERLPAVPGTAHRLILGQRLAWPPTAYKDLTLASKLGVSKVRSLVRETSPNPLRLQLRVHSGRRSPKDGARKQNEPNLLSVAQALHPASFVPPFTSSELRAEVSVARYRHAQAKEKPPCPDGPYCQEPDLRQAMTVEGIQVTSGELRFRVNLEDAALQSGELYRFQILLVPAPGSYLLPPWVGQWNQDAVAAEHAFDGSKTLNLDLFLRNLWDSALLQRPRVGEYYCYLKKT
ncbi:MAG: hypothetical protein U0Q16_25775 [Bryobacteraceae bacterium]